MLVIRREQMDVLKEHVLAGYIDRLVQHVRRAFPADFRALGESAVRERVGQAVARARELDIDAERDVARFVDMTFMAGPEFDREPWAQPILEDTRSSASDRLRRVQVSAQRNARKRGRGRR